MSSQLSDEVLDAYGKVAYFSLRTPLIWPPLDPNRKRLTRWQKLRWRWKRRWERLLSYRIVSLQDYRIEYDRY